MHAPTYSGSGGREEPCSARGSAAAPPSSPLPLPLPAAAAAVPAWGICTPRPSPQRLHPPALHGALRASMQTRITAVVLHRMPLRHLPRVCLFPGIWADSRHCRRRLHVPHSLMRPHAAVHERLWMAAAQDPARHPHQATVLRAAAAVQHALPLPLPQAKPSSSVGPAPAPAGVACLGRRRCAEQGRPPSPP